MIPGEYFLEEGDIEAKILNRCGGGDLIGGFVARQAGQRQHLAGLHPKGLQCGGDAAGGDDREQAGEALLLIIGVARV